MIEMQFMIAFLFCDDSFFENRVVNVWLTEKTILKMSIYQFVNDSN